MSFFVYSFYEYNLLEKLLGIEFEIPTVLTMKHTVFWDIALCSPAEDHWHLCGTYCLHLQD
jgi:hypothetical protein